MVKPGDAVFFMHDGERRYLKIYSIAMTVDGLIAKFDLGCACKVITKPLNKLYTNKEEFLAAIERGEA